MKWYEYPARISKESNIAFCSIWIISTIVQYLFLYSFQWFDLLGESIGFVLCYIAFVYTVKKLIWDK